MPYTQITHKPVVPKVRHRYALDRDQVDLALKGRECLTVFGVRHSDVQSLVGLW